MMKSLSALRGHFEVIQDFESKTINFPTLLSVQNDYFGAAISVPEVRVALLLPIYGADTFTQLYYTVLIYR